MRQKELEKEMEEQKKIEEDALAIQEARARVLARRKQKQLRDSTESITSIKSDPESMKELTTETHDEVPVYVASMYSKQISPNRNLSNTQFTEIKNINDVSYL